jgi:hypothetical protein
VGARIIDGRGGSPIEVGNLADPTVDIRNTRAIGAVWHNGKQVENAEVQAAQ